jgi:hypothetical protein
MFVLYVLSKDKTKAKCSIIKTKKQIRMKFRVQESTKTSRAGGMDVCVICCTVKDKETSTEKVQRENK